MKQIRIGIIGAGTLARAVHLPLLGQRVIAVAEPAALGREALQGSGLTILPDARELLARPDIDAVVIAAPSADHASLAIEALQAGKHVYLEKPLATSSADAARVVDAWKTSGKVGMVGLNYRFNPLITQMKQLLKA